MFKTLTVPRPLRAAMTALAAALAVTCGAAAQQPAYVVELAAPITLQQALQLALDANPLLAAARSEVEATAAQVLQGSLRPNPELTYKSEDASRLSRSSSLEIGVPVETGGKRDARVRSAELGRQVAQSDLDSRVLRVRAAVIAAFFDVLAAQEQAALAADSVQLARRATDIAAKRVAAGKVSPVEETRARVAEAGVRVTQTQADSELRNARRRLSSLWGNPAPKFSQVQGEVEQLIEPPSAEAIERRLAASPLLQRAQYELARRQSLVSLEQSRAVPDFTVHFGVRRSIETPGNLALFGVSVPLPVANRNQGNILEALRREDKAREELLATQVTLSSDTQQVLERVRSRRDEAELLRSDVLPGARSAYDAATIGFQNGKFSFLEVLDAQRTLFAAKSQYLNALANFHRAQAELESLLAQDTAKP
jgi:cobalt-zinc-cadmium efflux system outer membrane protein